MTEARKGPFDKFWWRRTEERVDRRAERKRASERVVLAQHSLTNTLTRLTDSKERQTRKQAKFVQQHEQSSKEHAEFLGLPRACVGCICREKTRHTLKLKHTHTHMLVLKIGRPCKHDEQVSCHRAIERDNVSCFEEYASRVCVVLTL